MIDNKLVSVGIAICSNKEGSKKFFDEYAILSMAQTRAVGKAFRNQLAWLMKAAGFVGNLVQTGAIVPDPKLEEYLRDLAGLPPAEHDGQNFGMPPMPEGAGVPPMPEEPATSGEEELPPAPPTEAPKLPEVG